MRVSPTPSTVSDDLADKIIVLITAGGVRLSRDFPAVSVSGVLGVDRGADRRTGPVAVAPLR
jgi:hypothetical protein